MNKVLIVDEHPITRMSIRMCLAQGGFDVVAEADNGLDALNHVRHYQPDLVVLDLGIPQVDAMTVIGQIRIMPIPAHVVVFTAQHSQHQPERCMQAGAHAYVSKTAEVDDLLKALRAAQFGYKFFPDSVVERSGLSGEEATLACLSFRELQVLQQLGQGLRIKEVAERMLLSSKTVSTYKTRLLAKFQVRSLLELIMIAKRTGLA